MLAIRAGKSTYVHSYLFVFRFGAPAMSYRATSARRDSPAKSLRGAC